MRRTAPFVGLLLTSACGLFGGEAGDDEGSIETSGVDESTGDVPSTGCPARDGADGTGTMWGSATTYVESQVMTAAGSPHVVSGSLLLRDVDL
ncbi:MAG TPA: hypothetical protein VG755_13580, partial [Nannocystaceae bacterium]|nr:hypothetical protein [Nannocystaceae bacterium]